MKIKPNKEILNKLSTKAVAKYEVFENTNRVLQELKAVAKTITNDTKTKMKAFNDKISIQYSDRGQFEAEMKFAADTLIMTMHTNVFEFPRLHNIMSTAYIKDDPTRSYCGIISFYNFLSDSFKYNRVNDVGYLVARIFINRESHFMVEGKRQIGMLYNNFVNEVIDQKALQKILETSILYCIDFDLLTPPYDNVKEVTVMEFQENSEMMRLKTGKRLGFQFQADQDEVSNLKDK